MRLKCKRNILGLVAIGVLVIFVLIAAPYYRFLSQTLHISPLKVLFGFGGPQNLNGRVNILLLGVPGGNHDGPDLSDSINMLSFDLNANKLTTVGIPRDVWSETIKEKINAAYAVGESIKPGKGMTLAKAEVSGIMGTPIHYAAVIRFAQFQELIDFLGGVDVTVEKSFTDNEFPITGKENDLCGGDKTYKCRYETISFQKGMQHMDGNTALKYVRSRHAIGEEGSDFSRIQRQQTVIKAIRAKVLSPVLIFNPIRLEGFYKTVDRLVERDISNEQGASIVRNILLKRNFSQVSAVLQKDLFVVPDAWMYKGEYVLVPKTGNFDEVHKYIDNLFQSK